MWMLKLSSGWAQPGSECRGGLSWMGEDSGLGRGSSRNLRRAQPKMVTFPGAPVDGLLHFSQVLESGREKRGAR